MAKNDFRPGKLRNSPLAVPLTIVQPKVSPPAPPKELLQFKMTLPPDEDAEVYHHDEEEEDAYANEVQPNMAKFLAEVGLQGYDFRLPHPVHGKKKDIDYDIRVTVINAAEGKPKHTLYKVAFGKYFIENNCKFETISIAVNPESNFPLIALFDCQFPMIKNSKDNIRIGLDQKNHMREFTSQAIGQQILTGLGIKPPPQVGAKLEVNCVVINFDLKGDSKRNFRIEKLSINKS